MLRGVPYQKFGLFIVAAAMVIGLLAHPASAQVFVLTVGPHGTYSNIQDAVDAVISDSVGYIQIEQHQYNESVIIPTALSNITLEISGGWDSTFTIQTEDPSLTTIYGGTTSRPVTISHSGGTVTLKYLTLAYGHSDTWGGGIWISPSQDGIIILDTCTVQYSVSEMTGPRGGGLYALLDGQDRLELHDCRFYHNTADSTLGGSARGGGIFVEATDDATLWIDGALVRYNKILGPTQAWGSGLCLFLSGSAQAVVEASSVSSNSSPLMTSTQILGATFYVSGSAKLEVRGLEVKFNSLDSGSPSAGLVYQLEATASDSAQIILGDTLVARGDAGGVKIYASDTSTLHSTNLTVADHPEIGIRRTRASGATMSLFNTIVFGNGTNVSSTGGSFDDGSNLVGVDPMFFDTGCGFYWLGDPDSPAIDGGDNAPPAGLGATDARGDPRVSGPVVDIGAYEFQGIFFDGFESCDTSAWSLTEPPGLRSPCP